MERTRSASRVTYLWPGLHRLWYQGDLAALGAAIAFAALVNGMLLASFVYSDNVPASLRLMGWVAVVAFWVVSTYQTMRRRTPIRNATQTLGQQDLYIRAQGEYLRGHWGEAQALLELQIRHNPADVESHLLLSSVFRRSDRCHLSRRQLAQMRTHQDAEKWRFEVQRELQLLDRDAPIT